MEKKSENMACFEAFVLQTTFNDGDKVAIGGICPKGMGQEAVRIYSEVSKIELGQYKDEFQIDYNLAKTITKLSPEWVNIVGASIHTDGVQKSTGGIIGNPFSEYESAEGTIEEITSGLYLISFSGGPGIAFTGQYEDGLLLQKLILDKNEAKDRSVEDITKILDKISDIYMLVTDGSGKENLGTVVISDKNGKRWETIR